MAFVEVAGVSEVPRGSMKSFSAGVWQVLVANVNGKFYASNNACPHAGWSLAQGTLNGTTITCALDVAKFDVISGKCVAGPRIFLFFRGKKPHDNRTFETKVEAGKIMVDTA